MFGPKQELLDPGTDPQEKYAQELKGVKPRSIPWGWIVFGILTLAVGVWTVIMYRNAQAGDETDQLATEVSAALTQSITPGHPPTITRTPQGAATETPTPTVTEDVWSRPTWTPLPTKTLWHTSVSATGTPSAGGSGQVRAVPVTVIVEVPVTVVVEKAVPVTVVHTVVVTPTHTPTGSPTPSPTPTLSPSPTLAPSATLTWTPTLTHTLTITP